MSIERQQLLSLIEPWIGTPFRDGVAMCGRGCDCKLFCVSIVCELLGLPVPDPSMFDAADRYDDQLVVPRLVAVFGTWFEEASKPVQIGDWLGFRFGNFGHAAIALGNDQVAHCSRHHGVLIEQLPSWRWARLAHVYRLRPGGAA